MTLAMTAVEVATPARPVLRWHGGKWLLAPWIIAHLPPHRTYVEPFGGAASVLLRKPRAHGEVYNDLDEDVVNLFRVLRDPEAAAALTRLLSLTPFSRVEHELAQEPDAHLDPVTRAWRLIIRSFMGFGSNASNHRATGFRANSNRSGTLPSHDWAGYPAALARTVERLRGVVIERRPAIDVMRQHDGPDTLHYCDPPYVHATRCGKNGHHPSYGTKSVGYKHELSDGDHAELLEFLRGLTGMVVLSGYPTELYDRALAGWRRVRRVALADGARKRIECLWINPQAAARLDRVLDFDAGGAA